MDNNGIGVGIHGKGGINWYRAHSISRRKDGSMCIFCLDENRTPYIVPAAKFAGVAPEPRGYNKELYPDMFNHVDLMEYMTL